MHSSQSNGQNFHEKLRVCTAFHNIANMYMYECIYIHVYTYEYLYIYIYVCLY